MNKLQILVIASLIGLLIVMYWPIIKATFSKPKTFIRIKGPASSPEMLWIVTSTELNEEGDHVVIRAQKIKVDKGGNYGN